MVSSTSSPPRSGVWYFSQGWKLVSLPGIRRAVGVWLLFLNPGQLDSGPL